ncbi:MAG TPA: DinB family protein [Myxococcota bacterium]|jgi:uncharacterized damage-inducible protein DinB|nr:DinB family protein [Myxococcota bacterium]
MIDVAWCRLMADYNGWMNERLYGLSATLPDGERKRDRGAFFGSLHRTLDHILLGDRMWIGRFTGRSYRVVPLGQTLYEDFDALAGARREMDAEIRAFARGVTAGWLAERLAVTSAADGVTRARPAWVFVTHLFNHQTHHRGQATTLLMQAGIDPGVTDLPKLPSLEP